MGIYMEHYILKLPAGSIKNYFTKDIVVFLIAIIVLLVGIILCFKGYKYFQTLITLILGCFSGYIGIELTDYLSANPIIKMIFFVIFTFIGSCLFYFLTVLIGFLLKKIHLEKNISNQMYIITSILGAMIIVFIVYTEIYNGWGLNLILFLFFTVTGIIYQKKKKAIQVDFHNYEDIINMKPLADEEKEHA